MNRFFAVFGGMEYRSGEPAFAAAPGFLAALGGMEYCSGELAFAADPGFLAALRGTEYQAMLGRFPLVLPIATRWKLSALGCALRATLGENTE